MSENNEDVKGEESAPLPLFTELPTRQLLGNPLGPGPLGIGSGASDLPLLDQDPAS